jgi:hypothetical protein
MTEILENKMVTTSNNKMQLEAITDQNEGKFVYTYSIYGGNIVI